MVKFHYLTIVGYRLVYCAICIFIYVYCQCFIALVAGSESDCETVKKDPNNWLSN